MKPKEIEKIAKRIIALENIVEANENADDVQKAKAEIMSISSRLKPDDMFLIDEIIQTKLQK